MKYPSLLILLLLSFVGYSQNPINNVRCDSLVKKAVDSTAKAILDSIANKKKNDEKTKKKEFLDILVDAGIEIRKGFAATTKDDQQPANLNWNKDFLTKYDYTSIDLAVRRKGWEIGKNSTTTILLLSPKMEWHKNGDTTSKNKNNKNTLSGGLNVEFDILTGSFMPFVAASVDYKHDYINKTGAFDVTGYASLFNGNPGWPGSRILWDRKRNNDIAFRYYIYTGFEYYKRTDSSSQSSTYWASKLYFEFNPFPQYLELTFEYTYRAKLSDSFYKLGDINWLSIGTNHYFDVKRRLGIGISYSRGNDPNNSFVKTKKIDLGLKFKI